jgi:serine/threonine-protein kinase
LFDQAIELPVGMRAAWLAEACGDDATLRDAVERLLQADARATNFLAAPPLAIDVHEDRSGVRAPPSAFGPFRVIRRIGEGGMGEVWLAERRDGDFEQRVAVKQVAWPTPGLLQRFREERRILARLEHPGIARLIDGGSDEGGAPWLAMEYVEGRSILAYADAHALDLRERLALFLAVCEAVQYAHQNLVVHRDLKPSNILVIAEGTPKLLDFGIAKLLDGDTGARTATGLMTPGYAAPEQWRGGAITTATDVYALGVVLHELLTGRRPQPAGAADGGNAGEFLPPSASPERAGAGEHLRRRLLRGDIDRIVLGALAPDPQRRYASAEALASDLRRWLDGEPISLRSGHLGYRLRKFATRHRWALAATASILIVSVIAAAVSQQQARRARAQALRADAMQQFNWGLIEQAHPNHNRGEPISPQALVGKGEQQLANFDGQPALQADMLAALARAWTGLSDYQRAQALLDRAKPMLDAGNLPDDVRSRVLASIAELEHGNARYADSLAHARESLALVEAEIGTSPATIAALHLRIAEALDGEGDAAATEAFLRTSLAADRAALGDADKAIAAQASLLGWTLGSLGHFEEAEREFAASIAGFHAIYGADSYDEGRALNDLGIVLMRKNDLAGAERNGREALRILAATAGPDHRSTLSAEHNLYTALESAGRFSETLAGREAFVAHAARPGLSTPRELAGYTLVLGVVYCELGRFAEAEATFRRSLALGLEAQGPRSPADQTARRELGVVLTLVGRHDEAEGVLHEALEIQLEHDSAESLRVKSSQMLLGDLLRREGRVDEALALLRPAATFADDLPDNNTLRPIALSRLAEAELAAGKIADALATAHGAVEFSRHAFASGHHKNGYALYALAAAEHANGNAEVARVLYEEALAARRAAHPPTHPRILEITQALAGLDPS